MAVKASAHSEPLAGRGSLCSTRCQPSRVSGRILLAGTDDKQKVCTMRAEVIVHWHLASDKIATTQWKFLHAPECCYLMGSHARNLQANGGR